MNEFEIAEEWFRYANNDLIVAKHCFEDLQPKQTEISSYHCQQSAEKALKGYLLFKNIEPPKTHDLKLLCKMCIDSDNSFISIADKCANLTAYGISVRYPEELCPDENMVKIAVSEAQEVYNFCKSKVIRPDIKI